MASPASLDVRPSDLDQSLVRVIFVSAVVLWSYANAPAASLIEALNYKYFTLAFAYWTFSLFTYGWTYFVVQGVREESRILLATRVISIFADIGAISAYTAISDSFGVILFPVYLNSIIGYGYRFGVRYLYFTLVVSATLFSIALMHNPYIRASRELTIAYYLGMILVPLYSASLLKKHRKVLERISDLNDARSRFIANMSHELRTPLHAIISVSDVLKETIDDANAHRENRHQKMQMISDSAQHLLGLVNKILDVASADAGKIPSRAREWTNIVVVTQTALRICQPKAQQQGIGFHWFFDAQLPIWIKSSAEYLQEILINTVGNAVKYTETGYVNIRFLLTELNGRQILSISIIDTGIGISSKLLPNIFEPFTLGDDSAARKYSGTGLGLTLTKQYVELLGGQIAFQSVEHIGTHCKISLPIDEWRDVEAFEVDTPLRQCLFFSPKPLRQGDLNVFREARWDCGQIDNSSLQDLGGSDATVIFIDSDLMSYQDIVFERLGVGRRPRLYVCYGSLEPSQGQHPMINCTVHRGDVAQLRRLHDLARAALPFVDEQPYLPVKVSHPQHVLLADDNPTNLATARMALESVGHKVTAVANGEAALSALDEMNYGIAFIDMHMPGMSGIEVAQIYQYVSNGAGTPIVILTADATQEARTAAEACGAVAFFTKPLRAREFRDAVSRFGKASAYAVFDASTAENDDDVHMLLDTTEIEELMAIGIGSAELTEMVAEFESDSLSLIDQAIVAYRRENLIQFKDAMHSLKGSAATLGAKQLSRLAHQRERMAGPFEFGSDSEAVRELRYALDEGLRLLRIKIDAGMPVTDR